MQQRFNESNYSFLIQALNGQMEPVVEFRIDQYVPSTTQKHSTLRASNVIQSYLSHLSQRTGLQYLCIGEGPKEIVDLMVRQHQLELF